jgi:hypothetical protein
MIFMSYNKPPRQPILPVPTTRRGKIGCGIALVLWFALLMLPCVMFWFASGNEIYIAHGSVPEAYDHPLLEIGLIMTTENRGIKFKTSSIIPDEANAVCVQTNLNYVLWYSREENPTASFCDCYERADTESTWSRIETITGECRQ